MKKVYCSSPDPCIYAPSFPGSKSPRMTLSFENFRGLKGFTPEELTSLKTHCYAKKVDVDGHHMYMGRDLPNYSQTTIDFRGLRYHFKRHQLALFLKKVDDPTFDMATGWENMTTSHLCNKKRCINPMHLELESQELNVSRNACVRAGSCSHHGSSPDCII